MLKRKQLIPYPWGQRILAALAAIGCTIVIADLFGSDSSGDWAFEPAPVAPALAPSAGSDEAPEASTPFERQEVQRVLQGSLSGVSGGTADVAVSIDGSEPIAVASDDGDRDREFRLWSVAKVLTGVALLRQFGWGEEKGEELPRDVERWLTSALVRSENCPQRAMTLKLQESTGGTEQVRELLKDVAEEAGAKVSLSSEVAVPDPPCDEYLVQQSELEGPLEPALLLGLSTWRAQDAAALFAAVQNDVFGEALSERLFKLLKKEKAVSREIQDGEYTADPAWGAGLALAPWNPAYKAGWGGSQDGNFLAEQAAAFEVGGHQLALAVAFHPDSQPVIDDPGLTDAPAVIQQIQGEVARGMKKLVSENEASSG